jgi:hypothetical protein
MPRRLLRQPRPVADPGRAGLGRGRAAEHPDQSGDGILIDTTLVGRVAVREALAVRIGYSGTDFTDNIVRTVVEERLNLAVERPAAICYITGLPTVAVAAAEETKSTTAKK